MQNAEVDIEPQNKCCYNIKPAISAAVSNPEYVNDRVPYPRLSAENPNVLLVFICSMSNADC